MFEFLPLEICIDSLLLLEAEFQNIPKAVYQALKYSLQSYYALIILFVLLLCHILPNFTRYVFIYAVCEKVWDFIPFYWLACGVHPHLWKGTCNISDEMCRKL